MFVASAKDSVKKHLSGIAAELACTDMLETHEHYLTLDDRLNRRVRELMNTT